MILNTTTIKTRSDSKRLLLLKLLGTSFLPKSSLLSYTEQHRHPSGILLSTLKQKQGSFNKRRSKRCVNNQQQNYPHTHHWAPKQQYKSKNWTIAIILRLTLIAWDSWTYPIGY